MTMGAGLRTRSKALDKPPDPDVRAPALDPTGVENGECGVGNSPPFELM